MVSGKQAAGQEAAGRSPGGAGTQNQVNYTAESSSPDATTNRRQSGRRPAAPVPTSGTSSQLQAFAVRSHTRMLPCWSPVWGGVGWMVCITLSIGAAQLGSRSSARHIIPHSLAASAAHCSPQVGSAAAHCSPQLAPGELSRQRLARTRYELPLVGVQHYCVHRRPAFILPLAAGGAQVPNLDCPTAGTQGGWLLSSRPEDCKLAATPAATSTLGLPRTAARPPVPSSLPVYIHFPSFWNPTDVTLLLWPS